MEEEFYKDDFEKFLQKHANNHRMYPGDNVWPAIQKKLHGHKKWPALTVAAILMLATTIAVTLYFTPGSKIFDVQEQQAIIAGNNAKKPTDNASQPVYNTLNRNGQNTNTVRQVSSSYNPQVNVNNALPVSDNKVIAAATPQDLPADINSSLTASLVKRANVKPAANGTALQKREHTIENATDLAMDGATSTEPDKNNTVEQITNKAESVIKVVAKTNTNTAVTEQNDSKMVDKFLSEHPDYIKEPDLVSLRKKNKISYTFYVTPSASYRRLKDDNFLQKNTAQNSGPVGLNFVADVNKVVRHHPGVGFEAGVGFTYQLTSTLGIRTGLQLNFRQYNIDAFRTPYELTSIALVSNTGVDTINLLAGYRNNNGVSSAEIVNRYFQVSIPIGIDWEVIGNHKLGFNLAATIQPTYVFKSDPYVLSSNFKNYTRNSNMLRNWNINSSVEAYLSVKTGEFKWQIGPQVRYQQLPTLKTAYPIHENLVDYGFKVGVTKFIK